MELGKNWLEPDVETPCGADFPIQAISPVSPSGWQAVGADVGVGEDCEDRLVEQTVVSRSASGPIEKYNNKLLFSHIPLKNTLQRGTFSLCLYRYASWLSSTFA